MWQQWFGGDDKVANFNYFTLGAQPLEQPWGSFTNLWDLKDTNTPKNAGVDAHFLSLASLPCLSHSEARRYQQNRRVTARKDDCWLAGSDDQSLGCVQSGAPH